MPAHTTPITLLRAAPRGFCAGVDRAIQIVERAIAKYGPPVYVRHEIVHNRHVVDDLRAKGAVFVEELSDIPTEHKTRPVIFSAHGVARVIVDQATDMGLAAIDATCPLVAKVHKEAERHYKAGLPIVLIGHAGHPEVAGTMGQLPAGAVMLIETAGDVAALPFDADARIAYVTQTALSVDDTAAVIAALRARYTNAIGPTKEDICYATTNRQEAVKAIAPRCDLFLVIGAANSSNSNRLVEVARAYGCPHAMLITGAGDIDPAWLCGVTTIGLSAGASAPEVLVTGVVDHLRALAPMRVEDVVTREENVLFNVPRELRDVG